MSMTSSTKFYHVTQMTCRCGHVTKIWQLYFNFDKDLTRKTNFFEGCSWLKFNNLGLALGMDLKFYISVTKGWKLKFRRFWG